MTLKLPVNQAHKMPQNRDMCFRHMELHTSQPIYHGTTNVNLCCNIAEVANCSIRGERCTTSAQASDIPFFCNPARELVEHQKFLSNIFQQMMYTLNE
jgi:hypothetical protein